MFSLALICAAAVESVTLPKLTVLGPVLPGVAYKAGTAKTAFDFRGEAAGVDAPVCQSAELPPPRNLSLHRLIGLHRDDGLVGILYEILRQFTVVLAGLFTDGVKRIFLLKEQVPGVGVVFEDGPNGAVGEMHSLHGLHAHLLQLFFRCLCRETLQEIVIDNLFAAILAKGISRQLKQGLYREYLNRKEDVAVVRGKIDMPGTIQNRLARKRVLTCEYDELSENNLLNQILKTTVMLLLRHTRVDQEYKSDLKKEMLFFSNVDTIDPTTIRWSAIRFQRNNNTYRMLISLCQLILEGMLLTTDSGEYKLASFVDEQRMNRLYEKFILEYYAKECPQVTATASQIPWALDDGIGTMLPVMQSDIMLTSGSEVLIIDAKYYTHTTQTQYDVHTLHSGNLYQIFTYVKNKDTEFGDQPHKVSGMLLYAATDEAIQPDNSYQMSGNMISVKTLDLNRDFSEIAAQLNAIVDEHFEEKSTQNIG